MAILQKHICDVCGKVLGDPGNDKWYYLAPGRLFFGKCEDSWRTGDDDASRMALHRSVLFGRAPDDFYLSDDTSCEVCSKQCVYQAYQKAIDAFFDKETADTRAKKAKGGLSMTKSTPEGSLSINGGVE